MTATKTRAEQRIEQLINIGRPLSDEESDELYRSLHADYMRKWRAVRAAKLTRDMGRLAVSQNRKEERQLLDRMRRESEMVKL